MARSPWARSSSADIDVDARVSEAARKDSDDLRARSGGVDATNGAVVSVPRPPPRKPAPFRDVSYLQVGQVFTGTQTVTATGGAGLGMSMPKNCDEWKVNVEIQGTDLARGSICGSMEALDVPRADSPVLTFWRGQIIDNINHHFRTDNWKAQFCNDIEHWEEFKAFNEHLRTAFRSDHGDDIDLSNRRHIFMRWKEIFFVSPENECNLTIAGFYYCCMDRLTGSIAGYYFDPSNQPWQKLLLKARSGPQGFAFADYEFR